MTLASILMAILLAQDPWPMYGQNPRRTGQSPFRGPSTAKLLWSYEARGGLAINMQPTVTSRGVFFGTWGLLRRESAETPDRWEKFDGKYYGLSFDGKELFAPLLPSHTPVGYRHRKRARIGRDVAWCGRDNDFLVSFYNGTLEGTACVDPRDGTHYVGRGDGRLFAIDPLRGTVRWIFETFNPEDREDPDGGGEIIGGPVQAADGTIYFGTVAAPWPGKPPAEPAYETNAVYAVDRNGKLVWRYPSRKTGLENWIHTPPAFSPDGKALYVGTMGGDMSVAGRILAFDLTRTADVPDERRLKWSIELRNTDRPLKPVVFAKHLAVGADGRIYGAGFEVQLLGGSPIVFAIDPKGSFAWKPAYVEPQGYPSRRGTFGGGIALQEDAGVTRAVLVTTTHLRSSNGVGGALYRVDPATGRVLAEFDPSPSGIGGMTAPVVDAAGTIFVGIRGTHREGREAGVNGRMYALTPDRNGFRVLWEYEVSGQLDWAAPAIGSKGILYFGSTAPAPPLLQTRFFGRAEIPPDTSPRLYALR